MRKLTRDAVPWVATGVVAIVLVYQQHWFGLGLPSPSGPARDVALPGGGVSDGGECGVKGYHYFELGAVMDTGGTQPGTPAGPQMMLGAYGARQGANDAGEFTISLDLATGSASSHLDLSAPLGPSGVAVEIEGPDGLIGGAHDLPVTLDDESARLPGGKVRVDPADGGLSVEVTVPAEALCPGYDVMSVESKLMSPIDSNNTITGQPPYTLTVSISDPAVAVMRAEVKSTATGPVLAANNLVTR